MFDEEYDDERLNNPGRSAWDYRSVYDLFFDPLTWRTSEKIPPNASGEVEYQGVRVILLTAEQTKRNKSKAMGRIVVECGCGKVLSFGRMEQHAKACKYARATLYLTPRIPPIEELISAVLRNSTDHFEFHKDEIEDFIDYCREAWLSLPKDPELQNAMRAEWVGPSATLRWVMSELYVEETRYYDRIARWRVTHVGKVFGTWPTEIEAENAGNEDSKTSGWLTWQISDITDDKGRVGNEAYIWGSTVHPTSDDSLELVATNQWEFINGDGTWVYIGDPPW